MQDITGKSSERKRNELYIGNEDAGSIDISNLKKTVSTQSLFLQAASEKNNTCSHVHTHMHTCTHKHRKTHYDISLSVSYSIHQATEQSQYCLFLYSIIFLYFCLLEYTVAVVCFKTNFKVCFLFALQIYTNIF